MSWTAWLSLFVFVACYALFVAFPKRRSWVACGGGLVLVASGVIPWHVAFTETIEWNVVALFFGTLVLADLFMQSRAPAVMAEWLVDRTRTARGAMVAICLLASAVSAFVENVAVVLLVAPVALSLADRLRISPVRLMILIAVSSNLQGTATLIGDPPSMILAGHMKLSFNDFFVYQGRAGIFFAVQAGAVAAMAVTFFLLRRHRDRVELLPVESVRSWVPSMFLGGLVVGLAGSSWLDPGFVWLAGTFTIMCAALGVAWYRWRARWGRSRALLARMDWDTTFFLVGVFLLVGGIGRTGWLDRLAEGLAGMVGGGNPLLAYVAIVSLAVVVSGVVDNVPFLMAMIPVTQNVAQRLDVPVPFLMFGLLIGSCLGGNITPIGASANIVAMGMLRRRGQEVGFGTFMAVGIPFTIAAVLAASAFVWWVWGP